ncbi:MAG: tRNA 2-thiouridine(34) synthase MnmA, partial [Candidatus Omnitrophica bacterium]|nr:tRNA 2-thiouridine(34) synthase MnmA [Candidatus Omnitrophota bacterium]
IKAGDIIDKKGNILGMHKGICFYTIGQRQGLGIAKGYPIDVAGIDAKHNRIIVGPKEETYKKSLIVKNVNFNTLLFNKKVELKVKIRYNHKEAPATLQRLARKRVKVVFKKPQFAVTPGQSAVFYDRDTLVGGGIIDKVIA